MKFLTIGEMARLHGVTEKTLRLYHKMDLLIPASIDPYTGYRYYLLSQSSRLDMILQMKLIGFSLLEIQQMLLNPNLEILHNALLQKEKHLLAERQEKEWALVSVSQMIKTCDVLHKPQLCSSPILEHIPQRRILTLPVEPYLLTDDVSSLNAWENALRNVKHCIVQLGLPLYLFRNIGCLITKEDLESQSYRISSAVLMLHDQYLNLPCEILKKNTYVTYTCNRVLSQEGNYLEKAYLAEMLLWIDNHGYQIIGDYFGEVLAETPAFAYSGRDMMVKLQIPVQ